MASVPTNVAHIEIARIASVLASIPEDHTSWLSNSEQERLASIRSDARRTEYLAGHWLTRVLLARAFGSTPAQWRLLERKSQPPLVQDQDALRVSITHTRDWIAAAVATIPIGIDLEQRPRKLDASIEALLRNADEAAGSLDLDAMLQRWVVKEAWIKRNAESALPVRLKQLHLRATPRELADVRIDSNPSFHFALAIAPGCTVMRRCEAPLIPGAAFAITDLESGYRNSNVSQTVDRQPHF
jgi:4'-phosphopantetheinyl transferase